MSAFIVSDNCINDVATLILNIVKDVNYTNGRELCLDLCNLNIEAVNQRYYENNEKRKTFKYKKSTRSELVQYFNMGCLEYQCTEGTVKDSSLYKYIFKDCAKVIEEYLYKKYINEDDEKDKYGKIIFDYIKRNNLKTYWGD